MKKTIKSLLAIAIAAFALSACSDVPEPAGYSIQPKGGTVHQEAENQQEPELWMILST